jgi:hypothetical protein
MIHRRFIKDVMNVISKHTAQNDFNLEEREDTSKASNHHFDMVF